MRVECHCVQIYVVVEVAYFSAIVPQKCFTVRLMPPLTGTIYFSRSQSISGDAHAWPPHVKRQSHERVQRSRTLNDDYCAAAALVVVSASALLRVRCSAPPQVPCCQCSQCCQPCQLHLLPLAPCHRRPSKRPLFLPRSDGLRRFHRRHHQCRHHRLTSGAILAHRWCCRRRRRLC